MYSDKESVNVLTSLLVAHGVRHAVVCPGSRNAPIVHNLDASPAIVCHGVTDERSAGFYALGMAQALHEPVVVCVTSGTALLNLLPAVAEAWYQHLPLVVVSADRPSPWIDQLDGQTLPQGDALGRFVCRSVTLPEADHWHCNRLVNEAMIAATDNIARPVHINVPLSEPLFRFCVSELPVERQIVRVTPSTDYDCLHSTLADGLAAAHRPMIVFGQTNPHDFDGSGVDYLFSHVIVLHEAMSAFPSVSHFEEVLSSVARESSSLDGVNVIAPPDFIIYIGGTVVSKRLKQFLRYAGEAVTWRIDPSGEVADTFMNLRGIVVGDAEMVLQSLDAKMRRCRMNGTEYRRQWLRLLKQASCHARDYQPEFSQMAAVRELERQIAQCRAVLPPCVTHRPQDKTQWVVHYGNSSAIRLANIYAGHHVWCNRGVNGIEGSLSTAAGFSLVAQSPQTMVCCVIGDLSFFYDQNALWNKELNGNFRVVLLNNGKGGIFGQLRGLEKSNAYEKYVAAAHHTTAEGICHQNGVTHLTATNMEELESGIHQLLTAKSMVPVLLEVITNADDDCRVYNSYFETFTPEI